jgi:para-nitrobenzyl esterase
MKTVFALAILSMAAHAADTVKTANGVLTGTLNPATGIRMFKGVPFAQPPVGDLRWKEPQPPKNGSEQESDGAQAGVSFVKRSSFARLGG